MTRDSWDWEMGLPHFFHMLQNQLAQQKPLRFRDITITPPKFESKLLMASSCRSGFFPFLFFGTKMLSPDVSFHVETHKSNIGALHFIYLHLWVWNGPAKCGFGDVRKDRYSWTLNS